MAAELVDEIPCSFQGGRLYSVNEYEVEIPAPNTNVEVHEPSDPNKRVFVVGIWLAEANAANLTLLSGAGGKTQTLELGANQGIPGLTGNGFYFATRPGETLYVKSSASIQSSVGKNLVLRVIEDIAFNNPGLG